MTREVDRQIFCFRPPKKLDLAALDGRKYCRFSKQTKTTAQSGAAVFMFKTLATNALLSVLAVGIAASPLPAGVSKCCHGSSESNRDRSTCCCCKLVKVKVASDNCCAQARKPCCAPEGKSRVQTANASTTRCCCRAHGPLPTIPGARDELRSQLVLVGGQPNVTTLGNVPDTLTFPVTITRHVTAARTLQILLCRWTV